MTSDSPPEAPLRHIVMFGFKAETSEAELDEIVRRFAQLRDLIPGIVAFEWGRNNSPEGKNQGRTHCFTLTFVSEEARDAYLPHPDHAAFVTFARQWIEHATVFDYWARSEA
jgi:hypothetical protein